MVLQVEVGGDTTTLDLSSLISQSEYQVSVTPGYESGLGQTMEGSAITGEESLPVFYFCLKPGGWSSDPYAAFLLLFSCSASSSWTDVVPAPKNLQFSDVGQTFFRASWDHGAPDVALYRIGWSKKGENNYEFVSQSTSCWFQDVLLRNEELLEKVLFFSWSVYEGLTGDLLECGSVVTEMSI